MKSVVMMNKRISCFLPREISQNVDEQFKTRKKIKIDLYDNFFLLIARVYVQKIFYETFFVF